MLPPHFASNKERWMSQVWQQDYIYSWQGKMFTEDQTRHIYEVVEMDKIINIETLKQEI